MEKFLDNLEHLLETKRESLLAKLRKAHEAQNRDQALEKSRQLKKLNALIRHLAQLRTF